MSLFSACRVIPSDPAQAAQEVAFVGRRTSGRQAEGGGRDGGGSAGRRAVSLEIGMMRVQNDAFSVAVYILTMFFCFPLVALSRPIQHRPRRG